MDESTVLRGQSIIIMDELHSRLFELASPYLDTRENQEHTRIAYEFAWKLLGEEGGEPSVVFPAVILHDVGWKCIPEDLQTTAYGPGEKNMDLNRVHEVEGARIAGEILAGINYPSRLIDEITEIILGHDSRKQAISKSDAVVKDSDKLWRYSDHAMRVNTERFGLTFRQNMDRLRDNLDGWFLTAAGRRMAVEQLLRHESNCGG
ncbi:MAG: HD domain-containing protein [Deltaproteobacteria bacterium]|nr:HD domain-containing protein [Deltaproteobacteria bacterium]